VVIANFKAIADSKQITLIAKLPEQRRWVEMDANLFHRLLDNLISSAIQSSPSGSTVILQIEHPDSVDSVRQAVIQVTDAGAGISKEIEQSILAQYESGTLTSSTSQLSLGLAFCKMVAEAHGGRITIENNTPQGSVITVEI